MASARTVMLSLLPRRIPPIISGSSISPYQVSKRSHSILAAAASSSGNTTVTTGPNSYNHDVTSHHHHRNTHHKHNHNNNTSSTNNNNNNSCGKRWLSSKYASVDHSVAYQASMSSSHGTQLQLALEEGKGKDDAPFDPFSQFLDQMGSTENANADGYQQHGEFEVEEEHIEEAEFEEIAATDGDEIGDDEDDDEAQHDEEILDDDEDEEGDDDDDDDEGPVYTTTGALHRPKSEKIALRAGYPAGGQFAVIHLAGRQHKVTKDDLLVVNKLKPVAHWCVGSTHTIKDDDVLLMGNQNKTLVGLPGVRGGEVDVMVEEITRDKTLIIFKKRRRKNSRRKNGFRRQVTFLRVLDVRMPKGEEVGNVGDGDVEQEVRVAA
eukprot:CAMPEP_0196132448 /NCGR_PEP_ID=MMETSP0910-20130528/2065_1 /TAXON_ID=49265 /ORGANISM="Thalassiosira rotula, Strain GSO102" /LENGTH=377 /DNA_ID=CAMNT_0041392057 /DNA_START=28 /DNA_END=1161 /DNA_ORIENTATION=+